MSFDLIVAVDSELGIGKNNTLPWKLSGDMSYFRQLTSQNEVNDKQNAVIMGRKTWDSLPPKSRPLKNRLNIVLSRGVFNQEGALHAQSLQQALDLCQDKNINKIFVIGGASIFQDALQHPELHNLYITEISQSFDCDTFFPSYHNQALSLIDCSETKQENGISYCFKVFEQTKNVQ